MLKEKQKREQETNQSLVNKFVRFERLLYIIDFFFVHTYINTNLFREHRFLE